MEDISKRCAVSTTASVPFTTIVTITGEIEHRMINDVPPSGGGQGKGPTPHELLEASLASCKAITVKMYADHKKWPLEAVTVRVRHDLRDNKTDGAKLHHFDVQVDVTGDLDDTQRERLCEIAGKCPIHKILESETVFVTELVGATP